jgi:hypothetical protein
MALLQPLEKSAPSSAPTSSPSSGSTRRTRHGLAKTPSSSAALSPSSRASWHSSSYPRSAKTRSKRRTSSSGSIWSATATTQARWARGRCWPPARRAARRRWGKRGRLFELCFVYVVQAVRLVCIATLLYILSIVKFRLSRVLCVLCSCVYAG